MSHISIFCHLFRKVQHFEINLQNFISCFPGSPFISASFHFKWLALLYADVLTHSHYMTKLAQSLLLHTAYNSSKVQLFPQCTIAHAHWLDTSSRAYQLCSSQVFVCPLCSEPYVHICIMHSSLFVSLIFCFTHYLVVKHFKLCSYSEILNY